MHKIFCLIGKIYFNVETAPCLLDSFLLIVQNDLIRLKLIELISRACDIVVGYVKFCKSIFFYRIWNILSNKST